MRLCCTPVAASSPSAYFDPQGKAVLKLYYGDERLSAPSYDYGKFFHLDESAAKAQLGPGSHNDAYTGRPDTRPWTDATRRCCGWRCCWRSRF